MQFKVIFITDVFYTKVTGLDPWFSVLVSLIMRFLGFKGSRVQGFKGSRNRF